MAAVSKTAPASETAVPSPSGGTPVYSGAPTAGRTAGAASGTGSGASAAGAGAAAAGAGGAESEDSEDGEDVRQYKVIVLGDGAVGKTSTLQRFANDVFGKSYKQTVGCDFFLKAVDLPGGVKCVLSCWDIGGQNMGAKMLRNYIFGAHAVIFACGSIAAATSRAARATLMQDITGFPRCDANSRQDSSVALCCTCAAADDITNSESFANCTDWLHEVQATFKDAKMPLLALVGNKTDMVSRPVIGSARLCNCRCC